MCLINGTTPIKYGSSAMLLACQHFALASIRRCRQSAGTQLYTARWERDSISCSSQGLQSFCLREVSLSMLRVLVSQVSLILCMGVEGWWCFLFRVTQKTVVSLTLTSIKLFFLPVLKAKSSIFSRLCCVLGTGHSS